MKASKIILGLFILIILTASASYAQQQFVQTVTAQNTKCNSQCSLIDAPGLNNNPAALIFLANGANQNANLIGALYRTYEQKWSIFYINGTTMQAGTKFNLNYYTAPDANHFVYIVLQRVHLTDDAIIDHAGLNNNPNAQIRIFPTNPITGNVLFNPADAGAVYVPSVSKWIVVNNAGGNVPAGVAYNVVFSNTYSATNENANKTLNTTPKIPISNSPIRNGSIKPEIISSGVTNENAGGDLNGNYPNPTVIGLQNRPLSNASPTIGQVLKWNGSAWEPANENVTTTSAPTSAGATTTSTPSIQTFFIQAPNPYPMSYYVDDSRGAAKITVLTHTIVLTKPSRLVISAMVNIDGLTCTFGCSDGFGYLYLQINNIKPRTQDTWFLSQHDKIASVSISNYMIDFPAGTYTIDFWVAHNPSTSGFTPLANYSSIMVIPL